MAQNISPRRGAAIAGFGALVLLVLVAALDNQWLNHWRMTQTSDDGSTAHSWSAGPIRGLGALAWRATKEAGEPGRVFLGAAATPLIAVLLTFLLLMVVCRGVGAERGRWSLFLGSWFATGLAAAAALIVGSAIADVAITPGRAESSGYAEFGRGDLYYTLITNGLVFGLFAGWLVGFVAVLVYGSTGVAEDDRTTREYEAPAYADYASSAVASSAPSSGASSSEDYSFSPTSPYASASSGESGGYRGYESADAPTQLNAPPHESDPNGGARSY